MLSWIMKFFWAFCCLFVFHWFCCCCLFSLWFSFPARILSLVVKMQLLRKPFLKGNNNDYRCYWRWNCMLLTGIASSISINFYRAVVNSALKDFSQWSLLCLEMNVSKLFSVNHTKLNINETNTYKVSYIAAL